MRVRLPQSCCFTLTVILCAAAVHAQQGDPPPVIVEPEQFSAPDRADFTAELLPDAGALAVSSDGAAEVFAVDLGWMPVEPNTAYRARYHVRPAGLREAASVYLMLREHIAEGERPFQPYHKEAVRAREIAPDPDGTWVERDLTFATGEQTQGLSGAVVVLALNGELQFGALEITALGPPAEPVDPAEAWAQYEEMMAEIRAQADSREPLTPRPVVFSRSQMKYGLQRNYYHQWNDRPLLVNRDYRGDSAYVTPPASYKRTLQQVAKYGLDGLAFFPETRGRLAMIDIHEELDVPGVGLLPEFLTAYTDDHISLKGEILERALSTDFAPRIDGKLLITSYGAGSFSPAQWRDILNQLRARVGDSFLFLPSLTDGVGLRRPLMDGEPISRADVDEVKTRLREYLDVCDGIYFNYPPALRRKDHSFDAEFYREVFIPVFKSVLAEPEYRDNCLGLSAYRAHMASDRGNNLHEDFTRTLRSSFEAAMDARPEVIILPEWDEQNENTSFRPTVYGACTTGRLLRYYMSEIRGEAPTPWPGDDTSIPNLILSTRKMITLGEALTVELVNVPDGMDAGQYQAQVTLEDEAGRTLHRFEPFTFDSGALQEERASIPSESLADVRAVIPVLTVRNYRGRDLTFDDGFHHVQLRGTWNWDYLTCRQPLRDILRPVEAALSWGQRGDATGPLTLSGTVSAEEDLGLVEVLGDDDEVYAVDPAGEFFRADADHERFLIQWRSHKTMPLQASLALVGAQSPVWLSQGTDVEPVAVTDPVPGQRVSLDATVSEHSRWVYFAVPRDRLDEAEVRWECGETGFSVALHDVLAKKMISYPLGDTARVVVTPYRRQIDLPHHLTQQQVAFEVPVWPEISSEQYHLRISTADGKVFRSRPLLVPNQNDDERVPLRVYSDTEGRGVDVQVAASRVPVLDYEFAPECGAVLLADSGRPFWGSLGGFTAITTGRGSPNGLFRGSRGGYPAEATRSAPMWTVADGRPCLEFDGVGTYIELPRESLPRRGSWTLSFEVSPADQRDQMLLINRVTGSQRGLALKIEDGKLVGSYVNNDWEVDVLETDLSVPVGEWSTITVRHDLEQTRLTVNGETASFEVTRPAINIAYTLIGDGFTGNWFAGRLRDLRITHNAR